MAPDRDEKAVPKGRPSNEERAARKRKAAIRRMIDRLPDLLDHVTESAVNLSVSPAVRAQLLQVLPRLMDLMPEIREEINRSASLPESARSLTEDEREALRQLC